MQSNPAMQHRVFETCVYILLFLGFLFHDTGYVVLLCTATYAKIQPAIAKALDAYQAALTVAQLAVDCLISGLDCITDFTTRLLRSTGIIAPPPVPDHFFISKKALNECFDRWGKPPVKRPVPSRAWAKRNRAETLEAPGSPTPTGPASSEVSGSSNTVSVSEKAVLSERVDTSSSTFKPRKADYWSTVPAAHVIAPAPKTGLRRKLRAPVAHQEASHLDTITETNSTLTATSPSPIDPPPATTNTAIERPAGAGAQDAPDEPRTPQDLGAALSTEVSGKAHKTGIFGRLRLQVAAAVASASQPRPNIDRIKKASRRLGFKFSGQKRREAAVAPQKAVKFADKVQVRDVPMSIWDELARREFISEEVEARIEVAYWAWVEEEKKVVPRVRAMLRGIQAKINARRFATADRWARARAVFHRG